MNAHFDDLKGSQRLEYNIFSEERSKQFEKATGESLAYLFLCHGIGGEEYTKLNMYFRGLYSPRDRDYQFLWLSRKIHYGIDPLGKKSRKNLIAAKLRWHYAEWKQIISKIEEEGEGELDKALWRLVRILGLHRPTYALSTYHFCLSRVQLYVSVLCFVFALRSHHSQKQAEFIGTKREKKLI